MNLTTRQSLLEAYKQVLSSRACIKENEEPKEVLGEEPITSDSEDTITEEDLDVTEESLIQDIKEFLGDTLDVSTFGEAGVMSNNAGLVVRSPSNRQFQITIIRSK